MVYLTLLDDPEAGITWNTSHDDMWVERYCWQVELDTPWGYRELRGRLHQIYYSKPYSRYVAVPLAAGTE